MTLQEIFNIVWKRAQTPIKALKGNASCQYRVKGMDPSRPERACFAGALVTDEEYNESWEGTSFHSLFDDEFDVEMRPPERLRHNRGAIADLQKIHDQRPVEEWLPLLRQYARVNLLKVPSSNE